MKYLNRTTSRHVLAITAGVICLSLPAWAFNPPQSLRAELVSNLNAQLVPNSHPAYYMDSSSGKRFLLDRTGPHALLQYEGQREIIALRVKNGPNGDEYFYTDTGHNLLVVTEKGNLRIFPINGRRGGVPVSLDASANAIIPPLHPVSLENELEAVSNDLATLMGQAPTFEVSGALLDYADWALEAVRTVSEGLEKAGAKRASVINTIRVSMGQQAALNLNGSVLNITVSPADGFLGRPSSDAVAFVVARPR